MSCLYHVEKSKIQIDVWSKMTHVTKKDVESIKALQVRSQKG